MTDTEPIPKQPLSIRMRCINEKLDEANRIARRMLVGTGATPDDRAEKGESLPVSDVILGGEITDAEANLRILCAQLDQLCCHLVG